MDSNTYVQKMLDDYPRKLRSTDTQLTPAANNLFENPPSKPLDIKRSEEFHSFTMRAFYAGKRARTDILQTCSVLATRTSAPTEADYKKLDRLMRYLNGTRKLHLTLSADDLKIVKWYVDAAFAVHPDFKSHTGAAMTYGNGAVQSTSRKQKLNTRSSTEC